MVVLLSDYRKKPESPREIDPNNVVEEGDHYWTCSCGHELFFITRDGALCSECGAPQNWNYDNT